MTMVGSERGESQPITEWFLTMGWVKTFTIGGVKES
jgi:hypothetical protein